MARTSKQVQGDIYRLLRQSTLASVVSGKVYHAGQRPRDSRMEDAIIIFTAGVPGQIDEGVVTLNIYCPDIDPAESGVWVEDMERTAELEELAGEWVQHHLSASHTSYRFRLMQTIYTEAEPSIQQHFVVVKLAYRYFDGGE